MDLPPKEQGLVNGAFVFAGLYLVVALLTGQHAHKVSKDRTLANHNRLMAWLHSFIAIVSMWGFWSCVYMAQMYPLYKPILVPHVGGHADAGHSDH